MKLHDILTGLGRPHVYFPSLVHSLGISVNASALLAYVGWRTPLDKTGEWIHLPLDQIHVDTGLTAREQRTARGQLEENGLIEVRYQRLDHRLEFRLLNADVEFKQPVREEEEPEKPPVKKASDGAACRKLIAWWCDRYKAKTKQVYRVQGHDAGNARNLIRALGSVDAVKELAAKADACKTGFWCSKVHRSLTLFYSRLNEVQAEVAGSGSHFTVDEQEKTDEDFAW